MKSRLRRYISLLLAVIMIFGSLPVNVFAQNKYTSFIDVKESDWFYDAVSYVHKKNIMNGTDEDKFSPNTITTRGMIVTILHRMEGKPIENASVFSDVAKDEYYFNAISWASKNNIVKGYGNGNFGPNDKITREQLATILYRYSEYKNHKTNLKADIMSFADGNDVSEYAIDAMQWALASGLIKGLDNNMLQPKDGATRSQVAMIIMRFMESANTNLIVENNKEPIKSKNDSSPSNNFFFDSFFLRNYTVTFNYNYADKGTYIVLETVNNLVERPANPTREGYRFDGWYVDPEGTRRFDFNTTINTDLVLYAKWVEKSTSNPTIPKTLVHTLNFDPNGGDLEVEYIKVEDKAIAGVLPEATRPGYTFLGWYTELDQGVQITETTPITKSMTLYAHWIKEDIGSGMLTVTFDRNDGSGKIHQILNLNRGELAVEPEDPSRDLYRFTGWFTDPQATSKYDFDEPIISDLVLYAGWGNPDGSDDGLYSASNDTETIFSVSDVTIDANDAIVTYNTNNVALVSVEIFEDQLESGQWTEEKVKENLSIEPAATGTGYTAAYGELAKLTIAIKDSLPENFLVKVTMEDSDGNSTEYISSKYTKTYREFNEQTMGDFPEDRVINFDLDTTTNFGVLANDVLVIPEESLYNNGRYLEVTDLESNVENDETSVIVPDHVYTLPDKNATFTDRDSKVRKLSDLRVGEVIYLEETTWLFKIETIKENPDGSISFTANKEATMQDFYDVLKVDFVGIEEEPVEMSLFRAGNIHADGSGSVNLGPYQIEKESDDVKLTGSLSGSVTASVKFVYDINLFSPDYFETSVNTTKKIELEVKAEVENGSNTEKNKEWKNVVYQVDTRGVKLPTGVAGLEIYIKPSLTVDWQMTGSVSLKFTSKQTSGFKYDTVNKRTDFVKKEKTVDFLAKGSVEYKFGPIVDIGIEFLNGVLKSGVVAGAGIKLKGEAQFGLEDLSGNKDSRHACGLCIKGSADWYATASIKLGYEITERLKNDIINVTILDVSAPITFNDRSSKFFISVLNDLDSIYKGKIKFGGGECQNKTYKTTFIVEDKNGQALDGIEVIISKNEKVKSKTKTPKPIHLYAGKYSAKADINGEIISKTFVISTEAETVTLTTVSKDTILKGMVVEASDPLKAIADADVRVSQGGLVVNSAKTDAAGNFKVEAPSGEIAIEVSKEDYSTFLKYETVFDGTDVHEVGKIELTKGTSMGGFYGVIRDASNNNPLEGVMLSLYKGWNSPTEGKAPIKILKTNASGEFRYDTKIKHGGIVGLPSGNYTLYARKDGYTDTSYNIVIYPGSTDSNLAINEVMSSVLSEEEYRIVLTWGQSPRDLDSHLVAETTESQPVHVYYSSQNPSPHYANLDVDDTSSYGPETITIINMKGLKNIKYAVHDYTNRDNENSNMLSNSSAIVRVFKGGQLLRTFNVPTGYTGTEWQVFSIGPNGEIKAINKMGNKSDPRDVLTELQAFQNLYEIHDRETQGYELKAYEKEESIKSIYQQVEGLNTEDKRLYNKAA